MHVPSHDPWHSASHAPSHRPSTSTVPSQNACALHEPWQSTLSDPGVHRVSTLPGSHLVCAWHPASHIASASKSSWHLPRVTTSAKFALAAAEPCMIALIFARATSHAPVPLPLAIASSV